MRARRHGAAPTMRHELDRPAWAALTSRHRTTAEGSDRAKRYDPAVVPFAATVDDTPASLEALGDLVRPGEMVVLLQADEPRYPDRLELVPTDFGVQMVAAGPMDLVEDGRVRPLGPADAADMLELATLTRPGPFTLRAQDIGRFWGIREEGRLVAMAGERMAQEGYVEVSGVATHPDVRGRGLGRLLTRYVAGRISAGGDRPYLHTFAGNAPAIALYRSIGFVLRTEMHVAMLRLRA